MMHLIAADWLKLRKRWMVRIIVLLMLLIIALVFWGEGTQASDRPDLLMPRGWVAALFLAAGFSEFLWPILGGNWAGSEYGWGTIRMILSRRPDRIQWALSGLVVLILAAGIALVLAGIVGSIAGTIIALLTGNSVYATAGLQSDYAGIIIKCFLAAWFVLTFYILLAYTAGTLFRSGAFGIGFGIGFTVAQLIVYGIFYSLNGTWRTIATHLPYAYTNALPLRLTREGTTSGYAGNDRTLPGITDSLIGLAIYCAILLAITCFLVRVRDVTD